MTSKQKIITGMAVAATALVVLGYATFEQWSAFVVNLASGL